MKKYFFKFTSLKTVVSLYCLLALSTSLIIYTAIRVNSITHEQSLNYNNHLRYHIANALFRQGTDLLTDAVRRYVVTMKPEYMEQYFGEVQEGRHRDRALEMVKGLQIDPAIKDTLTQAMKVSTRLMRPEYHAMHLIAPESHKEVFHSATGRCPLTAEEKNLSVEQRHERAEKLLWDDAYVKNKTEIYTYLSRGLEAASSRAMTKHLRLRRELLHTVLLGAISLTALVLSICGFFFYRHYQHEHMIEVRAKENARMNAQLRKEHEKSVKAEKAKSYFFSSVSHDIRTPLNSIIGFSEMLQLGIDDPAEKEKALDAIITSGHTLLELINDVLDLSKLESGKMELHPIPTDIATLVDKVMNSFEAAASRTSVRLIAEIGKMPLLKLDPQRIRQILFNLIGNAVKFTDRGSITVRAAYVDGIFTLSVADTGRGISEENIGKLMSPYVQLQEHDSTKGTGLGLAICKQLSKQMNGSLEIESTVGKGSTFTLRIPNVEAVSDEESAAYSRDRDTPAAMTQQDETITKKQILIVDDQELNLKILQTMLARLGISKVYTAANGRDALEILKNYGNVDIVLTDMFMPVIDGATLVREIRKSPRFAKIPVYAITADVEMQSRYRQMGFDDILLKPITLERLKEFLVKYSRCHLTDATVANDAAKA